MRSFREVVPRAVAWFLSFTFSVFFPLMRVGEKKKDHRDSHHGCVVLQSLRICETFIHLRTHTIFRLSPSRHFDFTFTSCETNPRKPDHTTPSPHGVEKWIARSNLWGIERGDMVRIPLCVFITVATKTLVTVKAVTRL